ncbi:universal stress protein PHOS34-like [Arachis stenosperma]|uniref:universal stress protein PHOS34-like n=1 Tax=Arachis stenosperma TaxID=217475 RepID=UPI0025ABD762|nr:universal stress protein PHOS34-like [Arachis stenosperma]
MKMKVMVAIDESEGSFYALKWALENLFENMASKCYASTAEEAHAGMVENEGGMVFLVHVQPRFAEYGYPIIGPNGFVYLMTIIIMRIILLTTIFAISVEDYVRKSQEEASAAILSRGLHMCKDKKVKAETIILRGDPREMICQAAEQVHVDLLVVGSRGLGTISRLFIGSVSDYCAHNAKVPILIVKPPIKKDTKETQTSAGTA